MALAVVLGFAASPSAAAPQPRPQPRKDTLLEAQLLQHIKILASDEFDGREPGTEGEAKTLRYLGKEWFDIGLVSGTNDPGHPWFAPVTLVAREPAGTSASFARKGRRLYVPTGSVLMLTSGKRALVENAPLLFVGLGRNVDALGRSELAGRVAVLLDGDDHGSDRQNALLKAGASAVLTVLDGTRTLEQVAARRSRSGYALASDMLGGDLEGFIRPEAFDRLTSVNLRGSYFTAQAGARAMIARGTRGRILLMSSVTGLRAFHNLSAYGITKAGIRFMASVLALELGPHGISAVCVHPGLTRTEKTPGVVAAQAKAQGVAEVEIEKRMAGRNLAKKLITAEDIAQVVVFLASPKSVAINGDSVAAGGGAPGAIHY